VVTATQAAGFAQLLQYAYQSGPTLLRLSGTLSPGQADAYAKAFGGFGVLVENTAEFPDAFAAAQRSSKPSIIHLKVDPEAITPTATLSGIREKSLAGGSNNTTHRS